MTVPPGPRRGSAAGAGVSCSCARAPESLERQQHARFLRQVYLPSRQRGGPEPGRDQGGLQALLDQADAVKFQPARGPHRSLAPLRDDAALLDPAAGGLLSAGGDAELRPGRGRAIPSLGERSGAVPTPPVLEQEARERLLQRRSQRWTSSAPNEAARRARLGGWTSPEKVIPHRPHGPTNTLIQKITFDVDPALKDTPEAASENWRNEMARNYMYTSSTHRAYADVAWDSKLPPKIPPPDSKLEKMADRVSHYCTLDTYGSTPEIWQEVGGLWDRFQTRNFHKPFRPITFVSPSLRVHQIPLYSGCIGAENVEDVDNPEVEFTPFTILRTAQPQNTDTAHKPNIPGYAGKVHWLATEPTNSNRPSASMSATMQVNDDWTWSSSYRPKLQAPFSRMITTVAPYNPFNIREKKEIDL